MLKKFSLVLLVALSCLLSRAQETNIYSAMSPELKQFFADHPGAAISLSNVLSEAFSNQTVQLYYFYTDDESLPRAVEYSPDEFSVAIGIRENQELSDQCIGLVFEILNSEMNSESEKRFNELTEKALSGKISRTDFAKGMLYPIFQSAKRTQKLLPNFKLSKTEIAKSFYYKPTIECPETFEAFLNKESSTVSYFERAYDSLRGAQQESNTAPKPTATTPTVSTNK